MEGIHVINDSLHVKSDDGLLPFLRFQKLERDLTVHESIFCEYGRAVRVLQDVEGLLNIGISVGIVRAEPVAGQMLLGGFVQAGGQLVALRVAREGISAPAGGIVPHGAAAGCIDVDTHYKGVVGFVAVADSDAVDSPAAFLQGDILILRNDQRGVIPPALQMLHDGAGNQTVVSILPEASVRRAFARSLYSVAIVN